MERLKKVGVVVAVVTYGFFLLGLGVWGLLVNGHSDGDYLGR